MKAVARHILVKDRKQCEDIKVAIETGKDFSEEAKGKSLCPAGKDGGSLGTFGKGEMVPEFDEVVFNKEIGKIHGPIKTQFGYHLVEVISRF